MIHRYSAYCANVFCLFSEEGIDAETPEEAEEIARMIHGPNRRLFELCREQRLPMPKIVVFHDCFGDCMGEHECVPEDSFL